SNMKVAIIGLGFMGGMHAQIYTNLPGVDLVAIADLNVDGTRRKAVEMGLSAEVYPDLKTLLTQTDFDVIDLCVPTDQHAGLAIMAAEAGKHLFIEKPLSLTLGDCRTIQKAVTKAGVFAQVGQCIRFWPEYVALKQFIDSGKGGPLKSLSLRRCASRPTYSQEDWLNDETRSGGAATDLHVHDTDFLIHLLGMPKSVYSQATRGRSGLDHIFTSYRFEGLAVHAEGGWDYPDHYGFCMAFEAVFENACVAFNSASGEPLTLTLHDQEPVAMTVDQPGPKESTTGEGNISSLGGYFNELEYFINCLNANKAPEIATLAQATNSIRVLIAELESARTGIPQSL
ncbi:MAG: Gfo/Idh/MocA family protein, partial [Verrucomicrobiales bacterium]